MIGSKYIGFVAALFAMVGVSCLASVVAAEDVPGDKSLIESQGAADSAEPSRPRSPIRVTTVDYPETGEDAGKLKLVGTATPGNNLYIFMDDEPLVRVVPDDDGNWDVLIETSLGDGVHKLRAEQYDPTTRMLAGRAMFSIERAKPGGENAAPPTSEP
jgi:hypothetical protein